MDNERRKKLIESMKKINKDNKATSIDFAGDTEVEIIKTGIESFDNLIGGGFKKGNFTILWGGESVGKTTLALQAIADAQKNGNICCYIDMERSFESERAGKLGVNLEELVLVSSCQTAEEALEIVRNFSKDNVIDLVVLDSIQSMSPIGEQENKGKNRNLAEKEMAELARTLSKFFRVVAPDVYRAKIACIMIGQVRLNLGSFIVKASLSGGLALKHWAYQSIFIRRGQKADAPSNKVKRYFLNPKGKVGYKSVNKEVGFDSVLKLVKTKSSNSQPEGSDIHLPFVYKNGFVNEFIPDETEIDIQEENREVIEEYLEEKKIKESQKKGEYVSVTNTPESRFEENPKKKRGRPAKKDKK